MLAALGDVYRHGPQFFWQMVPHLTPQAVRYVASFAVFEALLLMFMPGKTFKGPVTAGGNTPVYKACYDSIIAPYFLFCSCICSVPIKMLF